MPKISPEDKKLIDRVEASKHLPKDLDSFYNIVVEGKTSDSDKISGLTKPLDNHINMSDYVHIAMEGLGEEGVNNAIKDTWAEASGGDSGSSPSQTYLEKNDNTQPSTQNALLENDVMKISKNQSRAINKFPSLIEFLGREGVGDKIAKKIISELNIVIAPLIEDNSKSLNKNAQKCESDRNNIKQYFKGKSDNGKIWVCKVTASGPFTGAEGIAYDNNDDEVNIYRINNGDPIDVTHDFQVIHEFGEGIIDKKD